VTLSRGRRLTHGRYTKAAKEARKQMRDRLTAIKAKDEASE
jgi:hypothetical protein